MTDKRPITPSDLTRLLIADEPRLSPDGRWVAYVLSTPKPQDKGYATQLYLVPLDGSSAPVQLSQGGKDSQPRWSPDGRWLAFTSARSGAPQIYLLPIGTPGEARALTNHPNGAHSPAWSPDGTRLAFLASVNASERAAEASGTSEAAPQDKLEATYRKDRRQEEKRAYFDPQRATRIPYRLGTAQLDDRSAQVYVIAAHDPQAQAKRLTQRDESYSSLGWLNDTHLVAITPSSTGADEPWRDGCIVLIHAQDGAERLLEDSERTYYEVQAAPDGTQVACVRRAKDHIDRVAELAVLPLQDGTPDLERALSLNGALDRNVGSYMWDKDSRSVVAAVSQEGYGRIVRFALDGTTQLMAMEQATYSGLDVSAEGRVVASEATAANPAELRLIGDGLLTQHNAPFLDEVALASIEELSYQLPEYDARIQGWVVRPADYVEGKQYPTLALIHGGPHLMWGSAERSQWHEFQTYAAAGYVVFFCNPRGSDGYGSEFAGSVRRQWGIAMHDVLAGLEVLIGQGIADPERLYVTGGSYGGYLTAWIVSHSAKFRAAVAHRGVYNLLSFTGTSDIPSFVGREFESYPWEDAAFLWEQSPVAHAAKIHTPLLIIHAENDYRVPIEQGEQLFAYLRRLGRTVEFLRFPREGHDMTRVGEPSHRIANLEAILAWFARYA